MKKSYDYFKTLKLLSETVSVIYEKTLLNQDFSSERIHYSAEKSQLINNLQNEFITPLERGDIFLLQENISEELNSILVLQEYLCLINTNDFEEFINIGKFLKAQSVLFFDLKNYESNLRLFEQCSELIKHLNSEKRSMEKQIIDVLKCKKEQPLIKYAVYSALLNFNGAIYKTVLQIERILIDNS
ncbi:MAG: hypothetical protein IJN94_05840 [Clostridia bacterium]|nr:hypothetical protein [Clostridia bacterium]